MANFLCSFLHSGDVQRTLACAIHLVWVLIMSFLGVAVVRVAE